MSVDQNGLGHGAVGMLETWAKNGRHRAQIVGVMVSESPGHDDPGAIMGPFKKRDGDVARVPGAPAARSEHGRRPAPATHRPQRRHPAHHPEARLQQRRPARRQSAAREQDSYAIAERLRALCPST
ncbi:hypothetical protein ACRJ4W_09055 [Streptomyces sp. GLT-R25]